MRLRSVRPLFVAACILVSVACNAFSGSASYSECKRILFIGNSLTYINNLPQLFERYVEASYPGVSVCTSMIAKPGATLTDHRRAGDALAKLREQRWDYVVIQEGRDVLPGGSIDGAPFYSYPSEFIAQASFFVESSKKAGATPVLFETWGTEDDDSFSYVDAAFIAAQKVTDALIAPIGRVWVDVVGKKGLVLIQSDGSHPSKQGSMLAAMTLAQTLFGEAKVSQGAEDALDSEQVRLIQQEIIANHKSTRKLKARTSVKYQYPPTLDPDAPLQLRPGEEWQSKAPGFRYSVGALVEVDTKSKLRLSNYTSSGVVPLSIKKENRTATKLTFETLTGGVEYFVEVVRSAGVLKFMTSYQSDATHRVFSTSEYSLAKDRDFFEAMRALYDRLGREERETSLGAALPGHYIRLRDFLGPEKLKAAIAGFDLDEWDCIMVAWTFEDAGNLDRAVDYLQAAVDVFPNSLDARLSLAEMLVKQGKKGDALQILNAALAKQWPSDQNAQVRINDKLDSISK
jgi:hypothetical protein